MTYRASSSVLAAIAEGDGLATVRAAALRYVDVDDGGLTRLRHGKTFRSPRDVPRRHARAGLPRQGRHRPPRRRQRRAPGPHRPPLPRPARAAPGPVRRRRRRAGASDVEDRTVDATALTIDALRALEPVVARYLATTR